MAAPILNGVVVSLPCLKPEAFATTLIGDVKELVVNNLIRLCLTQLKSITCVASMAGLALSIFVPAVSAAPETARSADDFVDSIGVNTHLFYDNSVYYQKYNEIIKPKLLELGIRHIRDSGTRNLNGYLARLKELKTLGIRSTLVFDPRNTTPQGAVALVKELGEDVVEAAQGPNEYDLSGDSNWVNTLRTYQQQLYQAIKGDSATSSLPVYSPTLTTDGAYNSVGDLSSFVDYAAMNNYYSGRNPGTPGWGDNGYGSLGWNVQLAQKDSGSKPMITTETGYHNTVNTTDGHKGVPEDIAGKYVPRLCLEQFNYGISRTLIYEFISAYNDPNSLYTNFGLLHNDGSEKPAFAALKNLIRLVNDPGSNFTPGALNYTLSGDTTKIHHTLLQKRDGTFYLILWQEVSGFDVDAKQYLNISNQQVTLNLNQPIAQATIYLPNNSTASVEQDTNPNQINLNVPDYPIVVKLQPQ